MINVKHKVILELTVEQCKTQREAYDFAVSLAHHVLDTFYDNNTIQPLVSVSATRVK